MDEQKVIQVLRELSDKYGLENLRDRKIQTMIVKSYIPDMLNKTEYWDENLVLTQAMKSAAAVSFMISNLTSEAAKRAVSQLEKEAHMRREDAEFVIRCMIFARGGNPDVLMSDKVRQMQEKKGQGKEAEQKQVKAKQESSDERINWISCKGGDVGYKPDPNLLCISWISCKGGELYLYKNRLVFEPLLKSQQQLEILYQNIEKVVNVNLYLYRKVIFIHTKVDYNYGGISQKLFKFTCENIPQKNLAMSIIQKGIKGELNNF